MIGVIVAALADFGVFFFAVRSGMRLADAHLASGAVGLVLLYVLTARGGNLRQHIHLLVVSALAVFLRGAVLGLLTNVWGWPAQVSIVFAILATLAVAIPGYR